MMYDVCMRAGGHTRTAIVAFHLFMSHLGVLPMSSIIFLKLFSVCLYVQ